MNQPRQDAHVGDDVFYLAPGMTEPQPAMVVFVHGSHLVNLKVRRADGEFEWISLVPYLTDGEPDPQSPMGLCQPHLNRLGPAPRVLNAGTPHEVVIDVDSREV